MNISLILDQIEKTIRLLKIGFDPSNPWFTRTLAKYEDALQNPTEQNLKKLIGLSRAYLETASDWNQRFFIEVDKTEQLLKTYLKVL